MGEIDFEAEARAWVNWYRSHSVPPLPEHLAIEYERIDARARAEGKAEGYRLGVEAAIAPLRGMKTNERAGYMAAIPQTKELCAYTALILLECMGRIRALLPPEPAKAPHAASSPGGTSGPSGSGSTSAG